MIRTAVALRYARALFQLDLKPHTYKKRLKDFALIFTLFKEYPNFFKILISPLVVQEEKELLLKNALKDRVDPTFLHFLFYLIKKKRLNSIHEIFSKYQILVDHEDHVWEAELVSPVAVESKHKDELIDKLEAFYDKKIALNEQVDPTLVGGTLLILGNKLVDWSIKRRIEKLQTYLLGQNICH